MKILKVPYAEKDQAKALGARWNAQRKTWYVPDGQATAPFAQWLVESASGPASGPGKPAGKVDAYAGVPVVGALYVALEHDCNPFVECATCAPVLERCGWKAARMASRGMLQAG